MFVVSLDRIRVWAPVGLFVQESVLKNELEINISIAQPESDISNLPYYNYGPIHAIVQDICMQPTGLLEDVLKQIVFQLKQTWHGIKVNVSVTKLHPPIAGNVAAATVSWNEF